MHTHSINLCPAVGPLLVHVDLESRELKQAGLWQSSCPSARLIMQERHSRPPFILPGGEVVPACSPYHMVLAPPSILPALSLLLSAGGGCAWCWCWRKRGRWGGGVGCLFVECWNAKARSVACFLSSTLFLCVCVFLFFPLPFPFCKCEASEAEKKKSEKQASISPARRQQQPLFYLPSEGPDDSSGQARWMKKRSVWGGGGWGGVYIPRDSPQISPGNCSTMSLRIREQLQPLLGSLGDGDLGGKAQLRASAFSVCRTRTQYAQQSYIMMSCVNFTEGHMNFVP